MYDYSGHGNHRGRYVVHSHGVHSATKAAATSPAAIAFLRDFSNVPEAVAQHSTPVDIIDNPEMFNTSTRSKSVHGELGYPKINSCPRNSSPSPKISAPAKS